jgi:hypothetical protein
MSYLIGAVAFAQLAALLWTLEEFLANDFTPEIRHAWITVYGMIAGDYDRNGRRRNTILMRSLPPAKLCRPGQGDLMTAILRPFATFALLGAAPRGGEAF